MAQPVYLTHDIRRIEQAAGNTSPPLMERAGAAAAELAATLLSDKGKDVLVLAGPGNNGGDAKVVSRILQEKFFRVTLADTSSVPPQKNFNLVVDGLFGIGLARPIEGAYAKLIDFVNAQSCPVLALDIPSGLSSDTGQVLGRAVRATHTITFIGMKPGLLMLDGPDHCGEIVVADLGIKADSPPGSWIAEPGLFRNILKPRPRNFHKGMAGSLAVIGGTPGMEGAALLAGRAALKLGAGRVYVGMLDEEPHLDGSAPHLLLPHPDEKVRRGLDPVVLRP